MLDSNPDGRFKFELIAKALAVALTTAFLYLCMMPGQFDKDWVHLWTAGRTIVEGKAAQLFDPAVHHAILEKTYAGEIPEHVWPVRNQRYGVFFYPPPASLYYAALAWLPRRVGCAANAVLCVVLAIWCARCLSELFGRRVSGSVALIAILAFPPFFANYALGQNAMLTMAVVVTSFWLAFRDRDFAAGVLLGVFVAKPNWLLAVGWIPLIHFRWRMLAGMAVGGGGVLGLTLLIVGVEPFRDYWGLFPHVAHMHELPGYTLKLKSSALGMFRKMSEVGRLSDVLGWSTAVVTGLATVVLTRKLWRRGEAGWILMVSLSLMTALWVNPHLNNYDLMLMTIGVVAVLAEWPTWSRRQRIAAGVFLLFCYAADPIEQRYGLWRILPLSCFALAGMWGWLAYRIYCWQRVRA